MDAVLSPPRCEFVKLKVEADRNSKSSSLVSLSDKTIIGALDSKSVALDLDFVDFNKNFIALDCNSVGFPEKNSVALG